MQAIELRIAETQLSSIVDHLTPGEEVVLTRDSKPVATLRASDAPLRKAPRFGTLRGTVLNIAPDFDAIPEGFEEYLP